MPMPAPQGYEYLGGYKFAGSLQTSPAITIAPRDLLLIQVRVTGYSGGDIASLRFNGDSGANYASFNSSKPSGSSTWTDLASTSATLARLHPATTTQQRSSISAVTNFATKSKLGTISAATGTGSAASVSPIEFGYFEWVNTTAQITSVTLLTAGGSITMPAGTGFAVFGKNLPG